jgi:arylsulfatase A-like enzyme
VARLDIVLLVLDTQRADRLSCYGYPQEISPALDALAARATLFTRAFSAAQWTMPSHASLFTGLYPHDHGLVQSRGVLPATLPTLAERLVAGGYATAAFCNNPLVGVVNNGLRRGFQSFLNYAGLLTSRPSQAGPRRGPISRYRQFFKRSLAALLGRIQDSFARSDVLLALSFTPLMVPLWQTALSFKGNTGRSLADAARLLVERRGLAPDQPAFVFINLMGTHAPYHPRPEHLARFGPHIQRDPAARRYLRRFNTDIYGWLAPLAAPLGPGDKATLDGVYNAEVAGQDEQVGRFLERLRAAGRMDRTLLIVCADHGDHLGEKQLVGHSFGAYNEVARVPLIVYHPAGDLPSGTLREEPVSLRRVFHTVLDAAGLASADERRLSLAATADPDGGVVLVEAQPPSNVVDLVRRHHPDLLRRYGYDQPCQALISGDEKLIRFGERHRALYNHRHDLEEHTDLYAILPERADTLEETLGSFLRRRAQPALAPERPPADDPLVRKRLRDLGYLE